MDAVPKSEADKFAEVDSGKSPGYHWRILMRSPSWRPPTDVFETDETLFVRVEIAGMREEDFTIELNGRELTIRGARQDPAERRAFHQMEIRFGEFAFALELPSPDRAGRRPGGLQGRLPADHAPKGTAAPDRHRRMRSH